MRIIELTTIKGANRWSDYHTELVDMTLDIEELEHFPTNKITGFEERLKTLLPSLYDHRCSEDRPGGFFERVHDGTWMGHVIEHIAIELQCLAGMECSFGRTRSAGRKGVYHVVFVYRVEKAGIYAAKAAVQIADKLVKNMPYDIETDIRQLKILFERACKQEAV